MYKSFFLLLTFLTFWSGCTTDSGDNTIEATASKMMVIRLSFTNESFTESETRWQEKIFGENIGQLNHYYQEVSSGQFIFTPVDDAGLVQNGIVTLDMNALHPNPRTADPYFEQDLKSKVHPLFKTALEQITTDGFDFSLYDTNKDSKITPNELIIIFIMAGQEDAYALNSDNGIWAHEWCTEDFTTTVNGVSVMSCADGGDYAVFGERHGTHDATIGIIAHELGHVAFSLPDLYYGSATRIGYYGLMSNGSWGQATLSGLAGDTPTHFCAWSKLDIGWYRAHVAQNGYEALTLFDTGSNSYNIVKVPLKNSSSEYFLLENRGTRGYDTGLNVIDDSWTNYSGGIAIWHIDESVIAAKRADNIVNSDATHKGVDLEEANGLTVDDGNGDPSKNFYYSGNKTQFSPYTYPNTNAYNGTSSGINISDISAVSNAMTVNVTN